jgi:hypothetical protein
MQPIRVWSILIAGLLLPASEPLHAAPCTAAPSSFDDVATADSFCTNVEWLKNRAVTLGCTPATSYCPGSPVTRAQMALFMNRLADAIVPEPTLITETISNRTVTVFPLDNQFCIVNVPTANYPRAFSITGSVSISGPSSPGAISVAVRQEDNGGPMTSIEQVEGTILSGVELHLPVIALTKLGAGPKVFRMTLHTVSPPLTAAIARCVLRVEARSVTSTLPPY